MLVKDLLFAMVDDVNTTVVVYTSYGVQVHIPSDALVVCDNAISDIIKGLTVETLSTKKLAQGLVYYVNAPAEENADNSEGETKCDGCNDCGCQAEEVDSENKVLLQTPAGTLCVHSCSDLNYPTVSIDLLRPGFAPLALAGIECQQDREDHSLVGYFWGDAMDESYTTKTVFSGIESYFEE